MFAIIVYGWLVVALPTVKSIDALFCEGEFNAAALTVCALVVVSVENSTAVGLTRIVEGNTKQNSKLVVDDALAIPKRA